jgi:hypothetical protein
MYQENISKSELKERTGINLEEYRTDVVADSLTELIESPFTIMLHLILWPLLLLILFVTTGIWWIWPLSWGAGFLWIVGGLIMGPITGLTFGGFLAAWSLGESSKNLYEASLDSMKAIAEDRGIRMPSFFGYMAWSGCILIPLFVIMTFIWFR